MYARVLNNEIVEYSNSVNYAGEVKQMAPTKGAWFPVNESPAPTDLTPNETTDIITQLRTTEVRKYHRRRPMTAEELSEKNTEIEQQRRARYTTEVDPMTAELSRLSLISPAKTDEINQLKTAIETAVLLIKNDLPYVEG